jgi:hypothetical protein
MKKLVKILIAVALVISSTQLYAQSESNYKNSADNMLQSNSKLTIGGYGEVHYNQDLDSDNFRNGKLDVHRIVLLFGYNFNDRTKFISEVEFEHVKEVYIEQAFLQYKLTNFMNLRAGLMLVPMGIINEYHEPTTFHGVERPLIDKYIAPTTWREIGAGLTGNYIPASLKYQAYIMNGFNGYNDSGTLNGKNGLRKGRQKGAESFMSSPNFAGKVEYYGIRGLNLGLSGYFGKTQSNLYDGISRDDNLAIAMADSSVVTVAMIGADARYNYKGFALRGQYYLVSLDNTEQYNIYTGNIEEPNDLANSLTGYYAELGYNVLRHCKKTDSELIPFVRYEHLNTHNSVDDNITINEGYEKNIITTGLSWKITPGSVMKMDMQFIKAANNDDYTKSLNLGFGVMF